MNSRRGSILIVVILIVAIAAVAGVYFLGKQGIVIFPQSQPSPISTPKDVCSDPFNYNGYACDNGIVKFISNVPGNGSTYKKEDGTIIQCPVVASEYTKEDCKKLQSLNCSDKLCFPPNLTANWKTYRNSNYGFEFKYPTTFELLVKTDSISILSRSSTLHIITNADNTVKGGHSGLVEWSQKFGGRSFVKLYSSEPSGIIGEGGTREIYYPNAQISHDNPNGLPDQFFILIFLDKYPNLRIEVDSLKEELPTFFQILSTFHFLK